MIVSECLEGPDMWTIIYDLPPFNSHGSGLPFSLARFYAAGILYGLSHIHERGVVFRDLKPENVITDASGYVRIIDFGFASKVPYVKIDPKTKEEKIQSKLYTLCGTPEYLGPEFIFNLGHDQSADLWSFGVMIHELLMGVTPFLPSNPNDIPKLFTNIALVQKRGLILSPRLDEIENSTEIKSLLHSLLKFKGVERMGMQEGSSLAIMDHAFFADLEKEKLYAREIPAPIIPSAKSPEKMRPLDSFLEAQRENVYTGDQSIFEGF